MKRKVKDEYYPKTDIFFEELQIKKLRPSDDINYLTIKYHQNINLNEVHQKVIFEQFS